MNDEQPRQPDPHRRPSSGADAPASPALDWVQPRGATGKLYQELHRQLRRRRQKRLVATAVAAMLVLLSAIVTWRRGPMSESAPPASSTPVVSHPVRQVLPDGSIVELNVGATLALAFTEGERRVTLGQGQAHFQVAKNPRRPFVVVASGVEVRAVGTAFSVEIGAKSIDVLVTEGRVAIDEPRSAATAKTLEPIFVDAGNLAVVEFPASGSAPAPTVQPVTALQATTRLAWRAPRVEFTMTPLEQAIAVFQQHAGVSIHLSDPEMAKLELSGVVRADNIQSLLQLLEAEFQIHAERHGSEIVLRR